MLSNEPALNLANPRIPNTVKLGSATIGGDNPCLLIAGPCTVDDSIDELVSELVNAHGIRHIRGGCWKPRSEPGAFVGHGDKAIRWLLDAAAKHGVETVFTEVIDTLNVEMVNQARRESGFQGDIVLWVGARTWNPILLQQLGDQDEFPVMLKNPLVNGTDGLLERAQWVLNGQPIYADDGSRLDSPSAKHPRLLLCWRGTKQDDPESPYRFNPEHEAIGALQRHYRPPVILDPSHAAGTMEDDLVLRNLADALEERSHGVLLEIYFDAPRQALCDAKQAVPLSRLSEVKTLLAEHNQALVAV